jgi:hypothetical protein
MAMARHMFSNCSRISMVRSKPDEFGTNMNTSPRVSSNSASTNQKLMNVSSLLHGMVIFIFYTDDRIFASPDSKEVDKSNQ